MIQNCVTLHKNYHDHIVTSGASVRICLPIVKQGVIGAPGAGNWDLTNNSQPGHNNRIKNSGKSHLEWYRQNLNEKRRLMSSLNK